MIRILLLLIITISFAISSSDTIAKKINTNKSILDKSKSRKMKTSIKIKILAKQINLQNSELTKLEKQIINVNDEIKEHKELLENSKNNLNSLQKKSKSLIKKKRTNEEEIVDTIIENFSSSIAIKLANENSVQELIDNEIYTLLSQNSKDRILALNNNYENITINKKRNQKEISKISSYIKERVEKKKTLNRLISKHTGSLKSLEKKHKNYQIELKTVIKKQQNLALLLTKLNILKDKEIRKERLSRKKEKRRLLALKNKREKDAKRNKQKRNNTKAQVQKREAEKIDLDVRMLGSSSRGVKISRYRGRKTISPLKSFSVLKKFGKYYDPVYKIKLFNESMILKTKRSKSKVYSIFNGKIVYAKKNAGMLENVVIVQHKNGLHTIYSHLDEIAPTLKVGKWIKKGYVIGRVNDTLTFQATKNSYHINPKDLFKI